MNNRSSAAGRSLLYLVWALLLLLVTAGCAPSLHEGNEDLSLQQEEDEAAVEVVTTIFPLADIVNNLGAGRVKVMALLPPGASPHTFEPTVEQAKAVAKADLFIYVGGGLDDWVIGLAEAENIPTLEIIEHLGEWVLEYNPVSLVEEADHNQSPDQHHGHLDPHVWMDPILIKDFIAPLISEKLEAVDPASAAHFQSSLERFQLELEELHQEILTAVGKFTKKKFISYHSAWRYFARRYGLEEVASIEAFPGKEPSAKWLAQLVDLAEDHEIDVLFVEPQLSKKTTEIIAREIGGKVLILDPLGGKGVPGRESYAMLMRYNLENFRKALE